MKHWPRNKTCSTALIVALCSALLAAPAIAETPEEKGLAIAQEAERRNDGETEQRPG